MKKIVFSSVIGCLILSAIVTSITVSGANAEVDMNNKGTIHVNGVEISSEATVLIIDNEMFIPLRMVFEALKSEVIWEESTGNIYFDFKDENYICKPREVERKEFLPLYFIQICKVENKDSINNTDYIQLNPMSADGSYRMINDRTYLHQQTEQRLFEALGCKVEIDLEQFVLNISNN